MKSINSFLLGVLFASSFSMAVQAQAEADVPPALFGVQIGSIFEEYIPSREIDGLNVTRVTKIGSSGGYGYLMFFEPIEVDSLYPYIEEQRFENGFVSSAGDPFETSFRLLALPVLPSGAEELESLADLESLSPRQLEVGLVAWSDSLGAGSRGSPTSRSIRYDWARTVCLVVRGYVDIPPEITDDVDYHFYQCLFVGDTRELLISSGDQRSIQLKYKDEIIRDREQAVESLLVKLSNSP